MTMFMTRTAELQKTKIEVNKHHSGNSDDAWDTTEWLAGIHPFQATGPL